MILFFDCCVPISLMHRRRKGGSITMTCLILIQQRCRSLFVDDLAVVLARRIGIKLTEQCTDLEWRLQIFLQNLEAYSILTIQPINYVKTKIVFSARAVSYADPLHQRQCGNQYIEWIADFKYFGYWLATKQGWRNLIRKISLNPWQHTVLIMSYKVNDSTSWYLRYAQFSMFALPYFIWLFSALFLFTDTQQNYVNHVYFTLLKRIYRCQNWPDHVFVTLYNEKSPGRFMLCVRIGRNM